MIQIYWFPQKCPKCGLPMKHVNDRAFTYMNCVDKKCDAVTSCTRGKSDDCSGRYSQFAG